MHIEYVERLSLREQFRLVEIAHESSDRDIKKAALAVLGKYLNPLVRLAPDAPSLDKMLAGMTDDNIHPEQ
jgi:hypothetical protein